MKMFKYLLLSVVCCGCAMAQEPVAPETDVVQPEVSVQSKPGVNDKELAEAVEEDVMIPSEQEMEELFGISDEKESTDDAKKAPLAVEKQEAPVVATPDAQTK